jgi:hypothetical protein
MSFAAQINARYVAANYRQTLDLSLLRCTLFAIVVLHCWKTFPSTSAQVGCFMESSLGERHKGLANVQSPSWSHAE